MIEQILQLYNSDNVELAYELAKSQGLDLCDLIEVKSCNWYDRLPISIRLTNYTKMMQIRHLIYNKYFIDKEYPIIINY